MSVIFFFPPASQNQVSDLKEMNGALKKEVVELEKKLAHIRGVRAFLYSLDELNPAL